MALGVLNEHHRLDMPELHERGTRLLSVYMVGYRSRCLPVLVEFGDPRSPPMSTTSEKDAELLAVYRKGYYEWWQSDEAKMQRYAGQPRRDHAAGLRAVAAAAFAEGYGEGECSSRKASYPGKIPNPYALVTDERTKK